MSNEQEESLATSPAVEAGAEAQTGQITPPPQQGAQSVSQNEGQAPPVKKSPGRPIGWRKPKPAENTAPAPAKGKQSVNETISELDKLLNERMGYADPNLAEPGNDQPSTPINDQRFAAPEFIEEPFTGPVIQRAHTGNQNPVNTDTPQEVVPEVKFTQPPQPTPEQPGAGNPPGSTTTPSTTQPPKTEKPKNPAFQAMSGSEKRNSVKKTADMILKGYQQLAPRPFKWAAQFNTNKLERWHFDGKVNLNIVVDQASGGTIRNFVEKHNATAEHVFIITDPDIEALREPLEDYLMEQEVATTPLGRLLGALAPQILTMGINAGTMFQHQRIVLKQMVELTHAYNTGQYGQQGPQNPPNNNSGGTPVNPSPTNPNPAQGAAQQQPASTVTPQNIEVNNIRTDAPTREATTRQEPIAPPEKQDVKPGKKATASGPLKVEDYMASDSDQTEKK